MQFLQMRKLLFSVLIIILSTSWAYGQLQQEIVIENGALTINGNQITSNITVKTLDKVLKEAGKIISHKRKRFKDKHHGTRHVIPAYVEIIYNNSGLVFKGADENKISELQINFRSKEITEKYVLTVLEKEYELSKNDFGFNLSKSQDQKAFKEIYMKTFEPWTDQQFSGNLFIENQKVTSEDSIFDLKETNGNLYEDAFFDTKTFNQKFGCMTPASAIVVGFCECFSNGLQLILFDEEMKLQLVKFSFGKK